MARIDLILLEVSQKRVVSLKYVNKACHSPYFQNAAVKSPLEILRFPFSIAFSHKELMGYFEATRGLIVKMTKCRLDVHTRARRGRQIPPRTTPASWLLWSAPHLTQRGTA